MCVNCGHDECEGCVMGAAFPPPADRPVAGWRTMGPQEAKQAEEEPEVYAHEWRDEAVAQRAEVARLTSPRRSSRVFALEEALIAAESQRDAARALARELAEFCVGMNGSGYMVARRKGLDARAKLDALTP